MVLIDYYKTLNVAFDAQGEDIKVAYRQLAKKFHPDVVGDDEFYASRFKDIKEAYEVLSDPKTRALYNTAHKRFSKNAYAIGNNLVAKGSRDNGALYAWHPAHRKIKNLLSRKQSLFLGLSIVFLSVAGASVFLGMQRSTTPPVYADAGYEAPVKPAAVPTPVPIHPAKQRIIKESKTVASGVADSAPRSIEPDKEAAITISSSEPPKKVKKLVKELTRKPATVLPAIATLPVLPLAALPPAAVVKPLVPEPIPGGVLPGNATRYGYVVFTIRRNVQRTGIGNDTHLLTYVSGVSSYNSLSQEDIARVMLDADVKCSAAQSSFAKGFSPAIQTVTYNIESRKLKPFMNMQAAVDAMQHEPKSNLSESGTVVQQYGYLVFQVKREIFHPSGKPADTQLITYTTSAAPFGNLSVQQRADIVVKGEAHTSQIESVYATTHSHKDDKISYRIIGRNFKTFKTQTQADDSHKGEPQSINLQQ